MTDRATLIEYIEDAKLAKIVQRSGYDKCVKVGCIVMIVPERNRDGFCTFHRPARGVSSAGVARASS